MSQIKMEKTDLDNVPVIPVAEGYVLRTFREGDEAAIGRIYEACSLGMPTAGEVHEKIVQAPCFTPERMFLVEHIESDALVGTAAAWYRSDDPGFGYLHMVGLLPEHRGKRLGTLLVTSALRYTRDEGFSSQRLNTDDWRVDAIRLYLDLGYDPLCIDETHPPRWEALAVELNRPDTLARARFLKQQAPPG
jgi:mycothiol synthase